MPKDKASARDLVERGNELCRLDRITRGYEADTCRELEPLGRGRRGAQCDERIHHIVILPLQLAPCRHIETPDDRNV